MIRTALILTISSFIAGCGGSDSDSSTQGQSQGPTGKQVGFEIINTTQDDVDFFIKESGSEAPLYEETRQSIEITNKPISQYLHSWSTSRPLTVDISAKDTNTQNIIGTVDELVTNNGENYWLISWPDTKLGKTVLFTDRQETLAVSENQYAVRIFSLQDITLTSPPMSMSNGFEWQETVKKGQISMQRTLNNCQYELYIDFKVALNFCGPDVTAGKSYLLITDGQDLLLAAEEKRK